jgi:hypothetical protein
MEILDHITLKRKKTFDNGDWLLRLMSMKKNLIKKNKILHNFPCNQPRLHFIQQLKGIATDIEVLTKLIVNNN